MKTGKDETPAIKTPSL